MKRMCSAATVAALCAGFLGSGPLEGAVAGAELWAGYHFAGSKGVSGSGEATELQEVLALPQSEALGRYLVERLARTPRVLFPAIVDEAQVAGGIPLLEPLFADVLRHESFLELRGGEGAARAWLFGIALPPDRRGLWQKHLTELQGLWKIGTPDTVDQDGLRLTTVKRESDPATVRWVQSGEWLLLGVSGQPSEHWDAALGAMRRSGRPRPALTDGWLNAELHLARLAEVRGWPGQGAWPRLTVNATNREKDVRLEGRLVFAEPVTGPLDPWNVPTNTIQEPLISFSAMRGVRPLLERWAWLSPMGAKPAPNEVYLWAQAVNVPQSLFAFPANDPTNRVRAMLEPWREAIPARWRERGLGQVEWREEEAQVVWKSLPLLFPHVRAVEDGGRGYILGGTFPALPTTNAPPRGLLDQLEGNRNLVYYHWEITARRLAQLRMQIQLGNMVTGKSVLRTDTPAGPWLDEMERRLANSATELVAVSPREWTLTRRSPIGLTAAEVLGLLCWAESLDFPKPNLRFAEQTTPKTPPAPRKGTAPVKPRKKP